MPAQSAMPKKQAEILTQNSLPKMWAEYLLQRTMNPCDAGANSQTGVLNDPSGFVEIVLKAGWLRQPGRGRVPASVNGPNEDG